MDTKEIHLLDQLKKGNEQAFDEIFGQYYKGLVVFSTGVLKDKDLAEEVVQDLFVKLWENRKKTTLKISLKAYLFRAVYNNSVKVAKQKLKFINEDSISEFESNIEFTNLLEQTELEEKIYNSIESLPPQCKKIFKLSRFEELKYREIAEKLSISIKTVENQISKALKQLEKSLGSYLKLLVFIILKIF